MINTDKQNRSFFTLMKFCPTNLIPAVALLCSFLFSWKESPSQVTDWRNIRNGLIIPDELYCDQPYVVKTNDGAWLCVMTTGAGREGATGQYIVTFRSFDKGKSWIDKADVEPADGPEASYAVLLKGPSGRVFVFYNHNTDNVREILGADSVATFRRVDSQGYFVFKYSDDNGKTWSGKRYPIPVREFEIDRKNIYGGRIRFFWNVGRAFNYENSAYVPLIKVGGFGEGFFTSNEGVLLRSDNLLNIDDPSGAVWETLPDGDIGLRTPEGGGPVAAEQSYSVLSDGTFFCVYRSVDGYPVCSYSRDGGHTWDPPRYMRYADGRLMKHPRAANFAWKCGNGRYLYWFHNHGGRFIGDNPARRSIGYLDRNPAWLSGGIEADGPGGKIIKWSQPEILLYDDDPLVRISYPDLIEEDGEYYFTETQKETARIHPIDKRLAEGLWKQFENPESIHDKPMVNWSSDSGSSEISGFKIPSFYVRDETGVSGKNSGSGLTVVLGFQLTDFSPGQVLIDARGDGGKGWCIRTAENETLEWYMCDGRTVSAWSSDCGMFQPGQLHHVTVIVDAGPKMILFVTDGKLNDGADCRQFGWGRFNPFLQDINGSEKWNMPLLKDGHVRQVRIYGRALTVSEAVSNYRMNGN